MGAVMSPRRPWSSIAATKDEDKSLTTEAIDNSRNPTMCLRGFQSIFRGRREKPSLWSRRARRRYEGTAAIKKVVAKTLKMSTLSTFRSAKSKKKGCSDEIMGSIQESGVGYNKRFGPYPFSRNAALAVEPAGDQHFCFPGRYTTQGFQTMGRAKD